MTKQSQPKTYPPDTEALRKWLESLTVGEYKQKIEEILEKLMIPRYKLANWRSGVSKISPLEKKMLNEIAGQQIFKL